MKRPTWSVAVVPVAVAMLMAACSGDDSSAPSTAPGTTSVGSSTVATTDDSAPDVSSVDSSTSVTRPPRPTVTNSATDETLPPPSTTAAPTFEERAATERMDSALKALPEGWTGTVADVAGAGSTMQVVLTKTCNINGEYDFANLEADTSAAARLDASTSAAGGGQVIVDARVFERGSTADAAFNTLQAVFESEEGAACLKQNLAAAVGGIAREGEITSEIEETTVEGADTGAHAKVTISSGSASVDVYVDIFAKKLQDGTLLLGTFTSFGTPPDPAMIAAVLAAAAA